MNNYILEALGLTKDQVQKALGSGGGEKTIVSKKNYLSAQDQRRIRRRLKSYANFIVARFFEGYKPKQIANMLNVSEESIRSRLRNKKLFGSNKKAGRPKNTPSTQSCSRLSSPVRDHSYLVEKVYLNQSQGM